MTLLPTLKAVEVIDVGILRHILTIYAFISFEFLQTTIVKVVELFRRTGAHRKKEFSVLSYIDYQNMVA